MAYKFQLGPAVKSGSLEQEGSINIVNDGSGVFELKSDGVTVVDSSRSVIVGNLFKMPDVTSGKMLVADGTSYQEVAMSGDIAIDSTGATTIQNDAVEQAMIADDAVGADQLASNAVVEASIVDNAVTLAKMAGITRGSIIVGDASGDPSYLAKGTAAQFLQSDGNDPSYVSISGDATVAAGGALTIADNAVTLAKMAGLARGSLILGDSNGDPSALAKGTAAQFLQSDGTDPSYVSMSGQATLAAGGALSLAAAAITAQTEMTGDVDDADELMISDGGALKRLDFSVLRDAVFNDVSGDATVAAGGALTISANAVEGSMLNANVVADTLQYSGSALRLSASVAGAGLGFAAGVLSLDIDELDPLGGTGVAQSDNFVFSDNGTEKRITFSNLEDAIFASVSGQATVAAGGALSLAVDAISAQTEMTGDVADADQLMINDAGTLKRIDFSVLRDAVFNDVSGDASVAAGGSLTIANDAVEAGMLNDNVISGQDDINSAFAITDEILVSDNGVLRRADLSRLAEMLAGPGLSFGAGGTADEGKLLTQANAVKIFTDSDNQTLEEGMNAGSQTLTADRTLTLPANPSDGDVVHVKAPASLGGNELIISKGSADHRIDGQEVIEIESDGGAVSCMFIGSNTWVIF